MESLYRKYRPQTFDDVVGQKHVVSTLERAIEEGKTSHAYLFCGPRGTGKTTMARLLSKALLCEKGPNKLPCGVCDQCVEIANGEHPDVYELDAASRTGVDNVREEIINHVDFAPIEGRDKVYIIDEVHMLTTAAFNALLKTLEEPPLHVVFILCTTDPQKIPATILSRVQRFDFHAISNEDMQERLAEVCKKEGYSFDEAALELVCRHARGGMRDALSTLEQLSVFGNGDVSLEAAADLLGEVGSERLDDITRSLAAREVPKLFSCVAQLVDDGSDLLQFVRELAAHVRDVYVVSIAGATDDVIMATPEELAELATEAKAFGSPDRIARVLCVLGDVSNEMRTATNQRLALEIALTRIARPESDLTVEALADRVSGLERHLEALSEPGVRLSASPRPAAAPAPAPVPAAAPASAPEPVAKPAPERVEAPGPAPVRAAASAPEAASEPEHAPEPESAPQPAAPSPFAEGASTGVSDASQLQRSWKQVVARLVSEQPARGSLLLSAKAASDDGKTLTVALPTGSNFACKMLERQDVQSVIEPIVSSIFGPRRLRYVVAGQVSPAAAPTKEPVAVAPAPAPVPTPEAESVPAPAPEPPVAPVAGSPVQPDAQPDAQPPAVPDAVSSATPFPPENPPAGDDADAWYEEADAFVGEEDDLGSAETADGDVPPAPAPEGGFVAPFDDEPSGEAGGGKQVVPGDGTPAGDIASMLQGVFGEGVTVMTESSDE